MKKYMYRTNVAGDDGRPSLRSALRFAPLIVMLGLIAVCSALPATAQSREWKSLHQGNQCFNAGRYADAERHYREALKANPRSARAVFNLGDTFLAQNNPQEAMRLFADAAKNEPNKIVKAMAYHNMGYIHHKNKQYAEAIRYYKEALRNNPHDDDTRYNLALAQKQLKNDDQDNQSEQSQRDQSSGQDKQQQGEGQRQQQNSQPNEQGQEQSGGMSEDNARQLLELSRQSEQNTRDRLNRVPQEPRRKSLRKNW